MLLAGIERRHSVLMKNYIWVALFAWQYSSLIEFISIVWSATKIYLPVLYQNMKPAALWTVATWNCHPYFRAPSLLLCPYYWCQSLLKTWPKLSIWSRYRIAPKYAGVPMKSTSVSHAPRVAANLLGLPQTELSHWYLETTPLGRQRWHYDKARDCDFISKYIY
jgi:hypothetical protein